MHASRQHNLIFYFIEMQLKMGKPAKLDIKSLRKQLIEDNKYINDVFDRIPIPQSALPHDDDDSESEPSQNRAVLKQPNGTTRARSLEELQNRLREVRSKRKLNYKDKMLKKGLKNRLKKKSKRDERNVKRKLQREQKPNVPVTEEPNETEEPKAKPVFNREDKMVFSKFDFADKKKKTQDPKKALENLKKQNVKIRELKESGEAEKAALLQEKIVWKNALAKAQGEKVKDDPELLKKTLKRQEQKKKQSKKKWETREHGVKRAMEEKQKKRNENIMKRKKEKKVKKMKTAAKRGRLVPGF